MLDFNDADSQRSTDLIPDGTLVTVHMTVRPGNAGQGGWLKRSKSGESEALDCEFVVLEGPYAKRKFWTLMTMNGTTEGQQKAAEISPCPPSCHLGSRPRHQAQRRKPPGDGSAPDQLSRRLRWHALHVQGPYREGRHVDHALHQHAIGLPRGRHSRRRNRNRLRRR